MAVSNRFQLYSHDITNIMQNIWKNNDIQQEQMVNGVKQTISLRDYLNVNFFTFREEVRSVDNREVFQDYSTWFAEAFKSINRSFARLNIATEENLNSPDIDTGEISVDFEIIIQPEKIEALEKYWNNLRKLFLGETHRYTNANGQNVNVFLTLGNIEVRDGIDTSQLGKSISYVSNISVSYLKDGLSYKDIDLDISFERVLNKNSFNKIRFFEFAFDMVKDGDSLNQQTNPYTVGDINRNIANGITFNLYDLANDAAISSLKNRILLGGADYVEDNSEQEVFADNFALLNEPIWLRFTDKTTGFKYYYIMTLKSGSVTITNGQFIVIKASFKKLAKNIMMI